MVIKYAMGEKDIMIARRAKEELEKKLKECLQYKVKTLSTERTRLQGICEARATETLAVRKEGDKLREEVKSLESGKALVTAKLSKEVESHEETRDSLNTTFKQLCELQASVDEIKAEAESAIQAARAEEEEVKRKGAQLESSQSVKLMIDSVAARELDTLRRKHKELIQENNELSQKVQKEQQELAVSQASLAHLKETESRQKTEIVDLYAKCAELESVRLQLERETEKVELRDQEVARLREEAVEVQADMAAVRRKEADLLEFTQKLTDKNVQLQSEFSSVEGRAQTLVEEHNQLVAALARAEAKLQEVTRALEEEASTRREETELLARKLAEKTRASEADRQQVIDVSAEMEVVKRQNVARIRELTKELAT